MSNVRLVTILLALFLGPACGPSAPVQTRLKVRPDFTTPEVVAAFEKRYDLKLPPSSPPVLVEETGLNYPTIAAAIEASPNNATIRIPEGVFRESLTLAGRTGISLRGAGHGRTTVIYPDTLVYAHKADFSLIGMSLVSLSVGAEVPVVSISSSRARISDCRITGATGPGVFVTGRDANVVLIGNLVSGNMGGGIRVQGGDLALQRNVITLNAAGGLVITPSAQDVLGSVWLWHDTVLDNWAGRRCVSFSRTGVVPLGDLDRFRVEAAILNSAGIEETFSPEFAARVKASDNFLSQDPLPARDFFVSPATGDFSPSALIVKDSLGIELGAMPSKQGRREVATALAAALATEKLQLAYIQSLFLPLEERDRAHEKIRQLLNSFVDDYLRSQRLGVRLLEALGLVRVAPPEWRCGIILERFLQGFVAKYSFAIKPLNFFAGNPGLASRIEQHLLGRTSQFPRFIVSTHDAANAYVMSGKVRSAITEARKSRPFSASNRLRNPYGKELAESARMVESRLQETIRKIDDVDATLNNPHISMAEGSKYRAGLEKKREGLVADRTELEARLDAIRKQQETVKDDFVLDVKGEFRDVTVRGDLTVQFVQAPSGDILIDEESSLRITYTESEAFPLPEFGFSGKVLSGERQEPEAVAAYSIAERMLKAVIAAETAELKTLLERFLGGIISNSEEDRLVELILLNANLYRAALDARVEYDSLTAERSRNPEEIEVKASYDPARGSDKKGVVLSVTCRDVAGVERRVRQLEDVYKPYWLLQEPIDAFLKTRFGLTRKLFFETRDVLQQYVK